MVVGLTTGLAPVARSQVATGTAAEVRALMADKDLRQATKLCHRDLAAGRVACGELPALYRVCGEVAAVSKRRQEARRLFSRLLALEPQAQLGAGANPRARKIFDPLRRGSEKHFPVSVRVDPTAAAPAEGEPRGVTVHVVGGSRVNVKRVVLYVLDEAAPEPGTFRALEASGETPYTFQVPAILPGAARGYVEAHNEHGCAASAGRADAPLALEPNATPPAVVEIDDADSGAGAFYASPWFWSGVGAATVAVAGVSTLVVYSLVNAEREIEATQGERQLPLSPAEGRAP